MVGLALAVRHRTVASDGDLQALQKIEQRIAKEVERLLEIRGAADKIRRQVEVIDAAVDSGSGALQKLLKDAKKTLCALKVELNDEQEERASPILLSLPANDEGSVLAGE
jgi:16S rRNA C1402 N4-methylase RsmH